MKKIIKKLRHNIFRFLTKVAMSRFTPKLLKKSLDWLRIKFVRPEVQMVQAQRNRIDPMCPVCKLPMKAKRGQRAYSHKVCRREYRRINHIYDKREQREAIRNEKQSSVEQPVE